MITTKIGKQNDYTIIIIAPTNTKFDSKTVFKCIITKSLDTTDGLTTVYVPTLHITILYYHNATIRRTEPAGVY